MASPSTVEAETAQAIDGIGKPPPEIVLPPKDIRAIVEKTAGYVARNGPNFEERIRQKEEANPKFSFLNTGDAYNPYYIWRVDEIRAGRGNSVSAGRVGEEAPNIEPKKPEGPSAPPEFRFSARMPTISAQDLDIVKLCAFFTAKHGIEFMIQLSQREASNYQFDFLRSSHSFNQYFNRLVDQYKILLSAQNSEREEQKRISELTKNVKDKFHLLGKARQRAEYSRHQEQQKQRKEEEEKAEQLAYAQVDWHDFTVVETVIFDENDDESELPPPTSLADLQSASLEQKAMMSLQPANMRIEEAMPTDDMNYGYYQPQPPPPPPTQHPIPSNPSPANFQNTSFLPPRPSHSPPLQPPYAVPTPPGGSRPTSTEPQRARAANDAPMKIRSDYVPRAQAQRGQQKASMAICPNCRQQIPVDQLSEHMRIEMLDPRWKEQKAIHDSRNQTSNLSTVDVANNLKRLASQRTDVFDGVTNEPISEEEAARRKRAATSYDGIISGINDGTVGAGQAGAGKAALQQQARAQQMQSTNINEQLKHIRQKAHEGQQQT